MVESLGILAGQAMKQDESLGADSNSQSSHHTQHTELIITLLHTSRCHKPHHTYRSITRKISGITQYALWTVRFQLTILPTKLSHTSKIHRCLAWATAHCSLQPQLHNSSNSETTPLRAILALETSTHPILSDLLAISL